MRALPHIDEPVSAPQLSNYTISDGILNAIALWSFAVRSGLETIA